MLNCGMARNRYKSSGLKWGLCCKMARRTSVRVYLSVLGSNCLVSGYLYGLKSNAPHAFLLQGIFDNFADFTIVQTFFEGDN